MALVIPIISNQHAPGRGPAVLIVILDRENLDRMRQGDPFDVQARSLGGVVRGQKLEDLDLVIAYEEDMQFIMDCAQRGDLNALMAHVERGRVHRKEKGDATKPISLLQPKKKN